MCSSVLRTIIQSVLTWWRAGGCLNSLPNRGRVESHINSFLSITSKKISLWKFSYPKQAPNFSKKLLKDPSLLLPLGNSHSSLAGSITDFFTETWMLYSRSQSTYILNVLLSLSITTIVCGTQNSLHWKFMPSFSFQNLTLLPLASCNCNFNLSVIYNLLCCTFCWK